MHCSPGSYRSEVWKSGRAGGNGQLKEHEGAGTGVYLVSLELSGVSLWSRQGTLNAGTNLHV